MPQGLTGLTGFVISAPEATPEQRLGGSADARHANIGEVSSPYPWERYPGESHGPYGIENELLGFDVYSYETPAGYLAQDPTADLTPTTHAAPWPKGVPQSVLPDEVAERRQVSADIHASNMGGSREALYLPTADPVQDKWCEIYEVESGESFQADIPGQLKTSSGGWGTTDRVQSFARQNQYGFDSYHRHRRYAEGSIPGNYLWMEPGSRPMVRNLPRAAQIPTGPVSPFAGQDGALGFDSQGAVLQTLPSEYVPPPDPALATAYPSGEAPSVDYW